jgi:hypothetical protein
VTGALAASLVLAAGSAVALNWGYYAQHEQASALPPLSVRRPLRSLQLLFSSRRWVAGFFVGIGGWVLYVAALRLGPLSLVQATSAGGIGLLALFVARLGGIALSRREWIGVVVSISGLVLLALSVTGRATHGGTGSLAAAAVWMAASLVAACAAAGWAGRALAAGAGYGIAAGVMYAAGDVGTKSVVAGGGHLALAPAVLAAHGLAFVFLQLGFQRGGALATAGVATLFTNALPIAAGMFLFGEGLPGGVTGVARALSFVAVVAGAAFLTRASPVAVAAPVAATP